MNHKRGGVQDYGRDVRKRMLLMRVVKCQSTRISLHKRNKQKVAWNTHILLEKLYSLRLFLVSYTLRSLSIIFSLLSSHQNGGGCNKYIRLFVPSMSPREMPHTHLERNILEFGTCQQVDRMAWGGFWSMEDSEEWSKGVYRSHVRNDTVSWY